MPGDDQRKKRPGRVLPPDGWKEQFGRVIIEAHACGISVIGSSSGAIADVVGKGGCVVPERDPVTLASAIKAMMRDPAHQNQAGPN